MQVVVEDRGVGHLVLPLLDQDLGQGTAFEEGPECHRGGLVGEGDDGAGFLEFGLGKGGELGGAVEYALRE